VRPLNALLHWATAGLCAMLTVCSRNGLGKREATGPMLDVPPFSLVVRLSRAADDRLRGMGESMEMVAYFDGDALPGQGKYNPPMRPVYLGAAGRAVDERNMARFDDIKVPKADWNRLADKDYFVTINTVSARKVARDNLLDCADPMSVRISALQNKTTEIRCWLIGEHRR
jgi:hypothetical protein